MASVDYDKAYKLGKKEFAARSVKGLNPYLEVLDHHITRTQAQTEESLGLIQIPTDQIVGTKSDDRSNSFAANYMPILSPDTEFAGKWSILCNTHMEEGIREPIRAYEYMNKFYVQEGNKRVSVLKYFDAVSIPGYVTRIIPPRTEDIKNKIYYEFMDFYRLSHINYIYFTKLGSFEKLQRLVEKQPDEPWTTEEQLTFSSIYSRFSSMIEDSELQNITKGDIFLAFLELYGYLPMRDMSAASLKSMVSKTKKEMEIIASSTSLDLVMNPGEEKENLFKKLLPLSKSTLKVAFIHEKDAKTSAWTYAHELGRMHLEDTFGDQIQTSYYYDATEKTVDVLIQDAIAQGNDIIFTTAPPLLLASIRAAIRHPSIKILNCSLNASQQYIRTYYSRMYEAKFLMGAIAASISEGPNLGYIADYPIYGMVANINAFALGAKMIRPKSKVHLKWSTLRKSNPIEELKEEGVTCISGQDMIIPGQASRYFGLFNIENDKPFNLAIPVWHWGKFYEKMISALLNGNWKNDEVTAQSKAFNYWWGMSSHVVEVICSQNLPLGTQKLVGLLTNSICSGEYNPFQGVLFSQSGLIQSKETKTLSPEEIITMDWLCDNVIGHLPKLEELVDKAKAVVLTQGIETTN